MQSQLRTQPKPPEDCTSMEEVRAGVDQTDRELFALLERRFGYMRAAARIKPVREAVRDEQRKAAVIRAITDAAQSAGLPADALGSIWDELVETSITYEMKEWERLRK
ncbi:MAG: chorismate mutase [Sphingomonadaceae bacterium]|nr:chorismate mutase [Sphingomonadaceae bacterium]